MENNQDQLASQQEMLRDLQTQLSQATSEDEKRAIQLKMNVVNAKIAQLQNENSSENVAEDTIKQDGKWVNKGEEGTHGEFDTKKAADDQRKAMFANGYTEDAPYQKTHFLDDELTEGCMSKKFENMTNREIAKYIFGHPHTKFAGKMKECDDKEILKAIRDIKKANEEAPVTNTTAVANPVVPSMYMKRKLDESYYVSRNGKFEPKSGTKLVSDKKDAKVFNSEADAINYLKKTYGKSSMNWYDVIKEAAIYPGAPIMYKGREAKALRLNKKDPTKIDIEWIDGVEDTVPLKNVTLIK